MYRQQLNGYVPFEIINPRYGKHLSIALRDEDCNCYASNQDIENLLSNTKLMESIRYEIMADVEELAALHNTDEEISTRRFSRPSKERDYE